MEFIKVGLHGLAAWWTDHPDTPRAALVEASMALAWDGLRSQFDGPSGQEGAGQVGQAGVGPGLSEVSVEVGGSLRRNLTPR